MDEQEKFWPNYLHEREIGRLINQVEYLRDAVKTAQIDITNSLLSRKDLEHALENVKRSFEHLENHLDEMDNKIIDVKDKIMHHINNDKPLNQAISDHIGKIILAGICAGGGILAVEIFNIFKDNIINFFK